MKLKNLFEISGSLRKDKSLGFFKSRRISKTFDFKKDFFVRRKTDFFKVYQRRLTIAEN